MKVIFHELFLETYTRDPAAAAGRLDHALDLVQESYPIIKPDPCSEEDVLLVHSVSHLEDVKRDKHVSDTALLAAGATIKAAELCLKGEFAFALCRPPGHHASPDSCWGFCYFNNIAIAVEKLLKKEGLQNAVIIDFDLHFGDGTSNTFQGREEVSYYHVNGKDNRAFVKNLENFLESCNADFVAVSAGFDRHVQDWGGLLTTKNYEEMGRILGSFAREKCSGRLFSALEGGYNSYSLGESVKAFLDGLAAEQRSG